MYSPFQSRSIHQLPPRLFIFLETRDILELSCTNRTTRVQTTNDLYKRKCNTFEKLINYFYYKSTFNEKKITIYRHYDNDYYKNVRCFFQFLPEIFQFINDHRLISIDLSCPEYSGKMLGVDTEHEVQLVAEQFLQLLSTNRTLASCNLGLFEWALDRERVRLAVEHHPMMDYVCIRSNCSRTDFNKLPNTLYRNKTDNTFYWAHFRNKKDINY
jgi:hypothetical protein